MIIMIMIMIMIILLLIIILIVVIIVMTIVILILSEKWEVLLRGVGTLRYVLILGEDSACQVPICAVAASWFDNPHNQWVPRGQIRRSTSHPLNRVGGRTPLPGALPQH